MCKWTAYKNNCIQLDRRHQETRVHQDISRKMVLKLIIIRLFQVVHMLLVYNKNIFKNDRNSRGNELWNQSLFNSMAMLSSISQLFLTVPRFSGCICFSVHQYCKGALNITLPLPSTLFLTCSERDHY